jgi:MGT family glycosyltransferase
VSTEKRHIAFFNYPAHGHVNPTLPVVAELVERGHRVTYVVASQFADVVAATGASVLSYDSVVPKSWATVAIPAEITGDDIAKSMPAHFSEAVLPLDAAEKRFGDDRPDLMVYDSFGYASGRLLARKWGIPSLLTATTLAANEQFSPYAKLAETMPAIDPAHPAFAEYAAMVRETLDTHGMGEVTNDEFTGAAEDLTMVFVPGEFQPGFETFDERFAFVGPCLGNREHQGEWTPPESGLPVLLVALGSFGYENQAGFFRDCVTAFADLPWHVVLSLGELVKPEDLGPLPPNIEARSWVPQLSVLAHASAFVSHAGMGSTMESLSFGVPPVVVPRTGEQELVGDRVAELGLGKVIPPAEVTAESLRAAVLALAEDAGTRKRAAGFAERMRLANGPAKAADVVEARLAVRP